MTEATTSKMKPRIGISTCLLGEEVRWDGGHKKDAFLIGMLGPHVEWLPVCPELEVGMGVPREPVRLVADEDEGVRLVGTKTETDWTAQMTRFSTQRARALKNDGLAGYVLKRSSPSCGMERVKVYGKKGMATKKGRGLFAVALMEQFPLMPVEEEGRLNDARLRESFVERVFAYQRWRELAAQRKSIRALSDFHARHKYQLMAHDETVMRRIGKLVATAKGEPMAEVYATYGAGFMQALNVYASVKKHTNVLQHIFGHFSDQLSPPERQSVLANIREYHRGLVPLVAPVALLSHYIRTLEVPYVQDQYYLQPHPRELMLRNHA